MVRLSVNVNKIALIRNSRGGPIPDVLEAARTCLEAGCHGITVHPRPDARHITHRDVYELAEVLRRNWKRAEFNIEGYPNPTFIDLVSRVVPDQVTLVPDPPDALTSNQGWKFNESTRWLVDVIRRLRDAKMRVSVFVEPDAQTVENAKVWGANRIELYTGPYAHAFGTPQCAPILKAHIEAARLARRLGLGINAGHDLNLDNLPTYVREVRGLMEVSIGHALICDAIYKGLKRTVGLYLKAVGKRTRDTSRARKK
ncbi:MAG TPA: pyridoxine 5'-phosphate synthase [Candidatus Binataceae bacterium]|nr:pyridoxine 5'-phosphate synthase [Candidatus Binataceae bacterium]